MCGISGLIISGSDMVLSRSVDIIQRLNRQQAHRGPDAEGIWHAPNGRCVLGHRRLAVIDLDTRSNQPMLSADGRYALVFNGEIYNYQAIREDLEALGTVFRTQSDTEVLLHGFRQWGGKLFAKLDGMFALAVYDTLTKTLTLARDRIGEKPLYYARTPGYIALASEMKALLGLQEVSREVSRSSLFEYFTLRYVADPRTLFESIFSVQPGTYLVITQDGNVSEHSYYAYDVAEPHGVEESEYLDALEDALIESVKVRLIADVPLGAFLSSGVDSSLVCGIAATALGREISCFGAGFGGVQDNEIDGARKIAETYGLPFESYLVSEDDILQTARNFGKFLDEPNGDRGCVPMYFLSRLIRSRVTVAISGDGGDELFAGYSRYLHMRTVYGETPENAIEKICKYFEKGLPVFSREALHDAFPDEEYAFSARVASRFASLFARAELNDITRLRTLDLHTYLPGAVLSKVDKMSMRHSLEVRTPFFSPKVLNLSATLPASLLVHNGKMKLALRKLLHQYLPDELVSPVKKGFGMPSTFIQSNIGIFTQMANDATSTLAGWSPMQDHSLDFDKLAKASRGNINSLWAWIVLGQWVNSLP